MTYLYCLVEAGRKPATARAPRGLPGTGPLRVLQFAPDLWLIVADAPASLYDARTIEGGLRDLDWVAGRAAAHARVVEHFARRHTTVPMKLFTLFTADERAVDHVRGAERRVRRILARVSGRQEWGVRVRLDPGLARGRRRPLPPAARRSGTRFLMAKKQERDVARAAVREGRAAVEEVFASLAGLADATRRRPPAEIDGTRLLLDAALLVPAGRLGRFRSALRRGAAGLAARGYRLSLTGPWPAYSFVGE
jgi:hypothetical protein